MIKHMLNMQQFLPKDPEGTPLTEVNPSNHAPSSLSFCLLLKIIMRHPYLKILDLANLFVADAPLRAL